MPPAFRIREFYASTYVGNTQGGSTDTGSGRSAFLLHLRNIFHLPEQAGDPRETLAHGRRGELLLSPAGDDFRRPEGHR